MNAYNTGAWMEQYKQQQVDAEVEAARKAREEKMAQQKAAMIMAQKQILLRQSQKTAANPSSTVPSVCPCQSVDPPRYFIQVITKTC
jgi:hypothetical protein